MNREHVLLQIVSTHIQKGLLNPFASTGYPMNRLFGAAKFSATVSNIGGGSIKTGGGGMKRGLEYLVFQAYLKGLIEKSNCVVQSL